MKLARYRCAFPDCRKITEGPERKPPPCPHCGRLTTRILEQAEKPK